MANKFKVIGIKFSEGTSDLALFSTEDLAKQHIRTTFKDMGFDKLLVKPVASSNKDAIFIPDDIAETTDLFVNTKVIMDMLDWSKIKTEESFGTLTEFLLPTSGLLKTKSQIGKLLETGIEEYNEDSSVKSVSLSIVHSQETPLPYTRVIKQLQKQLETILIGDDSVEDLVDDSQEELEELSPKETISEEPKKEKTESEIAEDAIEKSKAEAKRFAKEQAEAEKAEQERLAKEQAEAEKAEQERLAKEQAEAEKAEQERLAKEQAEAEKAEQERLAKEQSEAEKAEQERLANEKAEAEKAEQERLASEKAEAEKAEQEQPKPSILDFDIDI